MDSEKCRNVRCGDDGARLARPGGVPGCGGAPGEFDVGNDRDAIPAHGGPARRALALGGSGPDVHAPEVEQPLEGRTTRLHDVEDDLAKVVGRSRIGQKLISMVTPVRRPWAHQDRSMPPVPEGRRHRFADAIVIRQDEPGPGKLPVVSTRGGSNGLPGEQNGLLGQAVVAQALLD